MKSPSTTILQCDPTSIVFTSDEPNVSCPETLAALRTAAHRISHIGEPVVFPTETVYGLGASALNTDAVSHIFRTKGRPADNRLIVHVSSMSMLRTLLPDGYRIPQSYQVLMEHFWPGPLTLLFPKRDGVISHLVTANQPTVAIRMPSHPVARALTAFAGLPLAAPSANTSGKPSPTRAEHVLKDLDGKVGVILDGGQCAVGLESTVVDGLQQDGNIRILRPGGVTLEDITHVLQLDKSKFGAGHIPRVLVHRRDYVDNVVAGELSVDIWIPYASGRSCRDIWGYLLQDKRFDWHRYYLGPKGTPSATAHRLFDGLITLDEHAVGDILIEEVSEEREGLAITNRVRKAATDVRWISLESSIT